jgi:hypothetical protein
MVKIIKLSLFLMVFVNFQIWTRIRNPRVTDPDPAKVPGSTTLLTATDKILDRC